MQPVYTLSGLTQRRDRARRWFWWRVLERSVQQITTQNMSFWAAGVAFYVFLAIPAVLSALIALYGLGFDAADVAKQIQALAGLLPGDVIATLQELTDAVITTSKKTLSFGLAVSVLVAVWSGRSAMLALMEALNAIFGTPETRRLLKLHFSALALAFYVIVFALVALILVAVVPVLLTRIPFGIFNANTIRLTQWLMLILLETSLLALVYHFGPTPLARCRWTTVGTAVAALLWLLSSALFSIYVELISINNKSYGSMGAIVILLTWLYLTMFVVLLGAGVNAAIARERQRGGC